MRRIFSFPLLDLIVLTPNVSVGRIIGTGVFSTPSSILGSVGSVGASLMLWVLGFVLSFCGLFIWLELGTMFPRSGGEKVYLEAVYQRPKHLATFVFAANAIILGFSSSNCIVGLPGELIYMHNETHVPSRFLRASKCLSSRCWNQHRDPTSPQHPRIRESRSWEMGHAWYRHCR